MSSERSMFPKCLVAAIEAFACVFFLFLVGRFMSAQSRASSKFPVTIDPCAGIVPFIGMGTLNVMLQMRVSKEGFAAFFLGTFEWTFVGV